MKEKFIIVFCVYSNEDNHLNVKGECSTQFLVDKNRKFEFDSEEEAKKILYETIKNRNYGSGSFKETPPYIYEIRKIYK